MKNKIIFKVLILAFIGISIIGCSSKKKKEEAGSIFAVNTTKVVKGQINDYLELNGDVKSRSEVAIYPEISGKLVNVVVKLGDKVLYNQIIAYVDPSKPGLDYKPGPVRSTINGTITSLPVEVGSTVSPQVAIAKIGRIDQLEVKTFISEKFISKIKPGLTAVVKSQSFPDKTFYAVVSEISPVVDPDSRMMEIKFNLLRDANIFLKSGMFVDMKVITDKKENIVKIPSDCIVKRYGTTIVFIVKRTGENLGQVEKREVKSGIQIESKTEITSGLSENEEIVYTGQTLLEDGSKIKIIETYQPITKEDKID